MRKKLGGRCNWAVLYSVASFAAALLLSPPANGEEPATATPNVAKDLKIFNGEKRLFASYGPSTSVGYPAHLLRKMVNGDSAHLTTPIGISPSVWNKWALSPFTVIFVHQMKEKGNRCELLAYDGQSHGFFNQEPFRSQTLEAADKFLVSIGWIKQE